MKSHNSPFPSWAPSVLAIWHEHLGWPSSPLKQHHGAKQGKWKITWAAHHYLPRDEMLRLIKSWASHADMEGAWLKLSKQPGVNIDEVAFFLCHNCLSYIAIYRSTPQLTKKQREKYFSGIARVAGELADSMGESVEFRRAQVSELLSPLQLENIADSIANVAFAKAGNQKSRGKPDIANTKFALNVSLPDVPTLLRELAVSAAKEAAAPTAAAHTAGGAAEITHLCRYLSRLLDTNFGKPMDAVVVAFVSAAYPHATTSVDQVRKARKQRTKL